MKIAIFHQLIQDDDLYRYAIFKKIHGKWSRIESVDNLVDINFGVPCTIPYVTGRSLCPYGCGILYFGDHRLLKSTLPEYFI